MTTVSLACDFSKLPFASSPRWVVWRFGQARSNSKRQKVPCSALTSKSADITDSKNWGTLEESLAALEKRKFDGLGFALGGGWVGIDLDNCRSSETGEIKEWAAAIMKRLPAFYWEVSPSGAGLHGVGRGRLQSSSCRCGQIEVYAKDRFFTVTGDSLNAGTDEDCSAELKKFHGEVFGVETAQAEEEEVEEVSSLSITPRIRLTDEQVIEKACQAKNAAKFKKLFYKVDIREYRSHSEADLALISLLLFWSRGDRAQADRLFKKSALYRLKWEEKRGKQTYGAKTIRRAWGGSVFPRIEEIRRAAVSAVWRRQSGNSAFNCLMVLLECAQKDGALKVQISERYLADLAHVTRHNTVRQILRRLEVLGWVVRSASRVRGVANFYRLQVPNSETEKLSQSHQLLYKNPHHTTVFRRWCSYESFDLWRRGELGVSGRRCFTVLNDRPVKARAIAEALHLSEQTVFRKLAKLRKFGLVVKVKGGWIKGPESLEFAAQKCRSAGKDKAQIAAHKRESEEFKRPRKTLKMVTVDVQLQRTSLLLPCGSTTRTGVVQTKCASLLY